MGIIGFGESRARKGSRLAIEKSCRVKHRISDQGGRCGRGNRNTRVTSSRRETMTEQEEVPPLLLSRPLRSMRIPASLSARTTAATTLEERGVKMRGAAEPSLS